MPELPSLRSLCMIAALVLWLNGVAAAQEPDDPFLPLSTVRASPDYSAAHYAKPLSFPQQQARYQAEQRMMRMEFNKWLGYDSLRPTVSAGYLYDNRFIAYSPYRGRFISNGWGSSTWFW